jgi:GNAT superfamily N-acetyltransferase
MIEVKLIETNQTLNVRYLVLRKGKPLLSCHFEGDNFETTKHFGLFHHQEIAGIVSVFENNLSIFTDENQYQIRGMAVLDAFQKKGFGTILIQNIEKYALSNKTNLIWFNARENAVGFYKKLGYTCTGEPFEINEIGTHFKMYKQL